MKDTIIKGTGNSRALKSVPNFLARYPTYQDFVAALVAGTLPVDFNGVNSAGFQQLGDPLNKKTLLQDTTAALYGLTAAAVPDDVLKILGKYAQHSWRRRKKNVKIYRNYETAVYRMISSSTYSSAATTVVYADSIAYDSRGVPRLVNQQSISVPISNSGAAIITGLKGKFISHIGSSGKYTSDIYYYDPSAADAKSSYGADHTPKYWIEVYLRPVTPEMTITFGEEEFVFSPDESAYPQSGFQNLTVKVSPGTAISGVQLGDRFYRQGTTLQYSDGVKIDIKTWNISLDNPQTTETFSYNNSDALDAIKGKYVMHNGYVVYIPSDATFKINVQDSNYWVVTSVAPAIVIVTTDGWEYQYNGVTLENAVRAPKIEVGSYFGTGVDGTATPNTLTLSFEPELVFVSGDTEAGEYFEMQMQAGNAQTIGCSSYKPSGNTLQYSISGKDVSWWYNTTDSHNGKIQGNLAGKLYHFVAIG